MRCGHIEAMRDHWRAFESLTYDISDSSLQDILSVAGFLLLARQVCRVRRCGIVLLAPVCSSFSWMSRYSTGRNVNEPLGHSWSPSATEGNLLVARTILLLRLIVARGCVYILEQPLGSIMPEHPRFQQFLREYIVYKVRCKTVPGHSS